MTKYSDKRYIWMGRGWETLVMYLLATIYCGLFNFKGRDWGIQLEESQNEVEDKSIVERPGSWTQMGLNSIY